MGRTYSDAVTVGTPMKGSHVRILRGYIEDDLDDASISFTWSWSNWSAGQDGTIPIRAIYFREMRDAIQELWDSKGRGDLPNWTQEEPRGQSTGHSDPTIIRASHVTDLRRWLNQYENNHPPLTQGIDSKSYDPLESDFAVIDNVNPNDWTGDISKLTNVPLFVRLEIRGRKSPTLGASETVNFTSNDYILYREEFAQYRNRNMVMFPVFTHQFHKQAGLSTGTETYRVEFASRVRDFLLNMKNNGDLLADPSNDNIVSVIIWNEPNVNSAGFMSQANFARLMYRCWKTIEDEGSFSGNRPRLYWAGIFSNPDDDYSSDFPWISGVYTQLSDLHLMDSESVKFPWAGINVHIHRRRDEGKIHDMLKTVIPTPCGDAVFDEAATPGGEPQLRHGQQ